MNPIFSSTTEFDSYLNKRVAASKPRPSSSGRLNFNRKAANSNKEDQTIDIQPFFQINSSKYNLNSTPASQKRKSNKDESIQNKDKNLDDEFKIDLVHTWRKHLDSQRETDDHTSIPRRPQSASIILPKTKQSLSPNKRSKYDSFDDDIFARISPPKPFPLSPARYHNNYISTDCSGDINESLWSNRVRVKILSKYFTCWSQEIQIRKAIREVNEKQTTKLSNKIRLKSSIRSWKNLYLTEIYLKGKRKKKVRKMLRIWFIRIKKLFKFRNQLALRDKFYRKKALFRAFNVLKMCLIKKYKLLMKLKKSNLAFDYFKKRLVETSFIAWKRLIKSSMSSKAIENERVERKDKIQAFLAKLKDQKENISKAPIIAETKNDKSTKRSSSTLRSRAQQSKIEHSEQPAVPKSRDIRSNRCPSKERTQVNSTQNVKNQSRYDESKQQDNFLEEKMADLSVNVPQGNFSMPPPPSSKAPPMTSPPAYDILAEFDSFPKDQSDNKVQQEKIIIDRSNSRKERMTFLREQAMKRVQDRNEQDKKRREEKEIEESKEADRILIEAKKKREAILRKKLYENQITKASPNTEVSDALKPLIEKADEFRRKSLIIRFGFAPWMRYINHFKDIAIMSFDHRKSYLLHKYWKLFQAYVIAIRTDRIRREHAKMASAATYYKQKLLRKTWKSWKMYKKILKTKAQAITGNFSRFTLLKRSWKGWKIAYERSQRKELRMLIQLKPRGDRSVMKHFFEKWRFYTEDQMLEKEINYRAEQKWISVQSWLRK